MDNKPKEDKEPEDNKTDHDLADHHNPDSSFRLDIGGEG